MADVADASLALAQSLDAELDAIDPHLTDLQRRFLLALPNCKDLKSCAERLNMSPDSVQTWKGPSNDPSPFGKALAIIRGGVPLRAIVRGQIERSIVPRAVSFTSDLLGQPYATMSSLDRATAQKAADSALKGTGYYRPRISVERVTWHLPPCLGTGNPAPDDTVDASYSVLDDTEDA